MTNKNILKEKIVKILFKYPFQPPAKGTEKGMNLITINKLLELFAQQKQEIIRQIWEIIEYEKETMFNSEKFYQDEPCYRLLQEIQKTIKAL